MKGDYSYKRRRKSDVKMAKPARFRALTVGDGDLTLSLAVARAYGHEESLDLVASTLLSSREDLFHTYSNSEHVLQELTERNVTVLFGVDATNLTTLQQELINTIMASGTPFSFTIRTWAILC